MGIGEIFWILMLIWLVFGILGYMQPTTFGPYWGHGNSLFLFILLFMLGWHSFGFMIRGQ
jgi:hypothetical protein